MYFKIALSNVKKSVRDYTIYFLTLTFGVCLFYMFNSIHSQQAVLKINESQRQMMELMQMMIGGISIFIAVILGLLIVYANQFLMKRRHKEMGIYLLLGMEKRQVSKILVIETLFIGVFALVIGLAAGVFLSQGLAVLTAKMFVVEMKEFRFVFSMDAFLQTIVYFAVIFLVVMIFNGISISKYKLIDLLNSAKKNQKLKVKNLWISFVLFIISIVCIGTAYHFIRNNGMMQVDMEFKMSILLGIIGTFLFFFSLSGFLLQLAKSNRTFYYRGLNMFVLRQINSKITTAFISMTMLCLMMFLAISAFATGMGMAETVKGNLSETTLFDYSFYQYKDKIDKNNKIDLMEQLEKDGIDITSDAKNITQMNIYCQTDSKDQYMTIRPFISGREKLSAYPKNQMEDAKNMPLVFIKLSDYNKFLKNVGKQQLKLGSNEYAVSCNFDNLIDVYKDAVKDQQKMMLNGETMKPYKKLLSYGYMVSPSQMDAGTLIVNDEVIENMKIPLYTQYVSIIWKDSKNDYSKKLDKKLENIYGKNDYNNNYKKTPPYNTTVSKESVYEQSAGLSTVITYIAIYIGTVFLITCAAVLALQQLSENADNVPKYQMLRKIGADQKMVNDSIKAQIIIYFLIPLSLALVHSYVGITTASNIISTLGHMNIANAVLRSLITVLVVYGGYMIATYVGSKSMLKGGQE